MIQAEVHPLEEDEAELAAEARRRFENDLRRQLSYPASSGEQEATAEGVFV